MVVVNMKRTREDIQDEVLERSKTIDNVVLELATGVGKTLAALKVVQHNGGRWLILINERSHEQNWRDDIRKHGMSDLLVNDKVSFLCYASLRRVRGNDYTGIIMDEAHHIFTDIRLNHLKSMFAEHRLFLSATITNEQKSQIYGVFGSFSVIIVTLNQAISWGILPKPKIKIIALKMNDNEQSEVHIITKGNAEKRKRLICDFKNRFRHMSANDHLELHVVCTQAQRYELVTGSMDYWKKLYFKEKKEFTKRMWLQISIQRKRMISSWKTDEAKKILDTLKDKRVICFTGSISQSNELGIKGRNVVNSDNKDNQKVIDKFNTGEIDKLFAVDMLKEGTNLHNIEAGVIVQLSSKLSDYVQKQGRVLRAEDQAEQYILFFKDTMDEVYVKNVIENMDEFIENDTN